MSLVSSREVIQIIRRTLSLVDPRLVSHGERVAYMVYRMLTARGLQDRRSLRDACMVAMLHDVGAYKTEEIDQMVVFETREVWHHAIYGYLFLHQLSPLRELAPAVLFHHLDARRLAEVDAPHRELAQLINLADRVDTYIINRTYPPPRQELDRDRDIRFSSEALALLHQIEDGPNGVYAMLQSGEFAGELMACMEAAPFTADEINGYLRMVVSAIDFRSNCTVTHTITTERIGDALAARMGLTAEARYKIQYGALVHDLGKIAIPLEILESPERLTDAEMAVMRTHVTISGEILGISADPEMLQIAVRHHEKLDGTGYPLGLRGDVLTPSQRILAVADIVSALSGARSYKVPFQKEQIMDILRRERALGKLCPMAVTAILEDYDSIMEEVRQGCAPVLAAYESIQAQYRALELRCQALSN